LKRGTRNKPPKTTIEKEISQHKNDEVHLKKGRRLERNLGRKTELWEKPVRGEPARGDQDVGSKRLLRGRLKNRRERVGVHDGEKDAIREGQERGG